MINSAKFTERLQKVIDYYGETASSFSEKIGVQRSSISHILSGRNKPSLDFVMKVLHTYPEVELYWLMNGKGEFPSKPKISESPNSNLPKPELKSKIQKSNSDSEIEKIVIFYKDGTFKSFNP
ncbi:helix-turn-helix transcriptional regulator [Winogradskyella echinorum]|uniref:Helix-turn-helix transcriptional regulator n=1 Tax=Winogradskyella echinorum TaxID=538189 RepID=A0ABR6Y0E3_9FLAO|nr:helix-turn-helix transcriptional regulator [Winogradskyella echinorum]MBC3846203.1 helix-turn-helix transcriptional regulator [Winogradskyella echinorum]MBC5750551.1 helix-turn-helix transcriptional regulator [Winogradskyella echinorum]